MYTVIREKNEIEKYQKLFLDTLHNNTEKFEKIRISFQGGSKICDVFWSKKFEYWSAFRIIKNNRYWNVFGLTKPQKNDGNLGIIVEINFSLCGGYTGGILAKDDNSDKIIIAHNGNITITGISKKESKEFFWQSYKGKRVKINDKEVAFIGELHSSDFSANIKEFIIEVERIKNIARNMILNDKIM